MEHLFLNKLPVKTITGCLIAGVVLGTSATLGVQWFNTNYQLRSPFQSPIVRRVISPIPDDVESIKVVTPTPTKKPEPTKAPVKGKKVSRVKNTPGHMSDREIADYIKSKGWDYSVAIRLAKSENFWNLTRSFDCTRTNDANTNGSYDVGIFQINSIHLARLQELGMTMEDMKDCKKNIDFAYEWIYSYSGWAPWSAYNNKSYLTHDEAI